MTTSTISKALLSALLLVSNFQVVAPRRVVAFQYVEDSAVCNPGSNFNIKLKDFHVDCGNANHGCTPGNSILFYGEFEAFDTFSSVADVDIKACSSRLGELICTTNFIATDMNVCADLELWDDEGYQKCNEVGYYSFEASYNLPNKTWWEDFAFEGLSFQIYVTLGQDLKCHGQFRAHIYYGNERWMLLVSVSSMALVFGAYYFVQRKREGSNEQIKVAVDEQKVVPVAKGQGKPPAENGGMTKKGGKCNSTPRKSHDFPDDESVTSTAYLRMLDFSPEGLSHRDEMEKVREAHFEKLRLAS